MKNLNKRFLRGQRGLALLATLSLLVFLAMMINTVLRGNVTRRRYLQARQDSMVALCLAEAGVHEALHALGSNTVRASLRRPIRQGTFNVEWHPEKSTIDTYRILSTGTTYRDDPTSACKRITVRVHVRRRGSAPDLRVLSWRIE